MKVMKSLNSWAKYGYRSPDQSMSNDLPIVDMAPTSNKIDFAEFLSSTLQPWTFSVVSCSMEDIKFTPQD